MVPVDDKHRMQGAALKAAIKKDREAGLIPFYVSIKITIVHHLLELALQPNSVFEILYN